MRMTPIFTTSVNIAHPVNNGVGDWISWHGESRRVVSIWPDDPTPGNHIRMEAARS